jgi:hypothetical protein
MKLYHPNPINADWVRVELLEARTKCEWFACGEQATTWYEGPKTVAFICEHHKRLVNDNPALGRQLTVRLWDLFQEGFNFINQVHASHGGLLKEIDRLQEETKKAAQSVRAHTLNAKANAKREARESLKQGKVGAPDDELAAARGVQSPTRDPFQLVFRVPEVEPPRPVALPSNKEPLPLIRVEIL